MCAVFPQGAAREYEPANVPRVLRAAPRLCALCREGRSREARGLPGCVIRDRERRALQSAVSTCTSLVWPFSHLGSYIFSFSQFLPSVTALLALCCSLVSGRAFIRRRDVGDDHTTRENLFIPYSCIRRRGRTPVESESKSQQSPCSMGTAPGARRFQSRRGCDFLRRFLTFHVSLRLSHTPGGGAIAAP